MIKKYLWLTLLFVFIGLSAVFALFATPGLGNGSYILVKLSRIGALLGFILFGIQFVLSTKPKFIEEYFGYDKMIGLHRQIGVVALILVLFHGLSALQVALGRDQTGLLLGIVAIFLFIFTLLFILAFQIFRIKYEYWEVIHQLNYVIFPMAYIHSIILGSSIRSSLFWQVVWVILGLMFLGMIIYKSVNAYRVRRHTYRVERVIQETPNIWTVQFKPHLTHFEPGQFMILRLILNGAVSEPHPFTIASSPTQDTLAVSIKSAGDFTAKISQVKPGDYAYIDAPYGRFSFLNFPKAEKSVFIAGGIGITPFISMLRYMRDKGINNDVLLLWGNRNPQDIAFRGEMDQLGKQLSRLQVVHVLSESAGWDGETGFITAGLIQKYGGDLKEKEFFLCGPPIMMKLVLRELKTLNVPQTRIHFERFSW